MWQGLWPDRDVDDVPIRSITNGVHARTWISDDLAGALGADEETGAPDFARAYDLGDEELWEAHGAAKRELLSYMRTSRSRGEGLDPDALTIGFARRFATYKRADLLFSDPDRLSALLNDADRPLQLVLAGKAHPQDEGGKALIQRVVEFARDARAGGRVVFLEDYEMTLARYLVQGVDVWLNTPRRPLEASGTSGMKAALNGVLNCSILDGWWAEGYSPETGFAIGDESVAPTDEEQDAADREALFAVLVEQVLPAYYERDDYGRGVPPRWLGLMRHSIAELGARFSTNRMVAEYVDGLYCRPARHRLDQDPTDRARRRDVVAPAELPGSPGTRSWFSAWRMRCSSCQRSAVDSPASTFASSACASSSCCCARSSSISPAATASSTSAIARSSSTWKKPGPVANSWT